MTLKAHLQKMDWILAIASLLISGFGLLSLYGSAVSSGDFSNFYKQALFLITGTIIMFLVSFFDWRFLRDNSVFILSVYFFGILALIGLFFFAPEIRGIKSWYRIGPFNFDPIEPVKFLLILLLAKYFSKRHIELYRIRHIFLSGVYALVPALLIFLQPDFGSASIIMIIWMGMLLVSGIKVKHFMVLCLIFILIFSLSWSFILKDYQKDRISGFLFPQEDPLGKSWSQNQAKIAIGSGGFIGQGIGEGSQTQNGFLPEPQTDFIFSAIAEETGFVGISILLSLFAVFFWRILKIALNAKSNFARLFASGFSIAVFFQMFVNISMNLGFLPVIGVSLPLVSYGGSNIFFVMLGLGIIQNINICQKY